MKKFITPTYTFTPGASGAGTVNLSGIASFDVKKLVSIINQTRGTVIYATGSAGLKYTNVSGTTVTLFADTSTHNAADVLQVIYESDDAVTVTGVATEAKQDTGNTSLSSIDGKLTTLDAKDFATQTTLASVLTELQLKADLTETQPVSAASLPLPTGAATSANQTTGNSSLSSIDGKLTTLNAKDFATAANQATTNTSLSSIDGKLPALSGGRVPVDIGGNGSITITSGTVTVSNEVEVKNDVGNPVPVSATSLPLPTGAATESTLSALNTKVPANLSVTANRLLVDGSGVTQPVSAASLPLPAGAATESTLSTVNTKIPANLTVTSTRLLVDGSGVTQPVSAASLPLPSGAATETTLSALNTKTPSLGQATMANSSPVVIASNQSAIPVSSTQLPSALGQANNAGSLSVALSSTQTSTVPAPRGSQAVITTPAPQGLFRVTFASAIASGVDTSFFTLIQTGSGQAVSQSAGNLVLTSGTTTNSETIIRSNSSFVGSLIARIQTALSQRIANNNFFVELVDVIGDNLAVTVNSATSITVTIPSNPFTAANVGQSIYIGAVQNISATAVPGRYAIASVAGNAVTFTVAGWPASGSGTCSLFGWNYYQLLYTGSGVTTTVNYDAQRRGYASGATAATINTTASPGHLAVMTNVDGNAYFSDQLVASVASTAQLSPRASRVVNLPDENVNLVIQLRAANGSTAPASTTTWTVGMVSVENFTPTSVVINDIKPLGPGNQMPVAVTNTPNIGTVTTVSAVTSANLGLPGLINDVPSAALTTSTTTVVSTISFGTAYQVNVPVTAVTGSSPTLDFSIEESDDTGTNWYRVYDFARITATGMYRSPVLRLRGNRIRYVQTVGGATPSFTRAINRLQESVPGSLLGQFIDRSIVPNTLNSTSPTYYIEGMNDFSIVVRCTAQTTAATIAVEFSDDSTNWSRFSKTITTVNGFSAPLALSVRWRFVRLIVTSAGTGITLAEATIKTGETDTDLATETTLLALNAKTPSLGQGAMAASSPVVIASDQSAIPASQSGTWNINNISGTVSLPTGAATSALQTTGNTSLSSIDSKTPSVGQALMAASTPVVIASNQSAVPVSAASLPLPTGAATETTLSALNAKVPSVGQALMAASTPVVIASNQSAIAVSAASLPLPTGAATSANQTTTNTSLSSIDGKLGSLGQKAMVGSAPVVIASDQTAIPASQSGTWNINNISGSVSLPTGAATSALQTTANTSLSNIEGKLGSLGQKAMAGSAPVVIASDQSAIPVSAASLPLPSGAATETTLSALNTKVPANLTVTATRLLVDGSGVTQPVSGSVSVSNFPATQNVAVTSALPAGNNNIGDVDVASLPVAFNAGIASATTQRVVIASDQTAIPVTGTLSATITGVATETKQDTGNTSLASIDSKLPALSGGRVPVDIGGSGSITITSGTVTVSNEVEIKNDVGNPVPVSASSLPLPTGAATESTLSALNTKVPANLTVTATRLLVDGSGVTQPISAASLPLPSGAATETTLSALNGKLGSLGQKLMTGSAPVVIASDQSAIPASQSGTWNITNISGTVSLPTGAATAANQTTEITHLSNIAGATLVDNAAFTDGTTRVDVAGFIFDDVAGTALTENDVAAARIDSKRAQVAVFEDGATRGRYATVTAANAVKVDGSAVTQPISAAALPLPTGASTETTLSAVSGKLPATLGQKTSANSLAVSIASDQSAVPASQSGTWNINNVSGTVSLPTGAATSALQTTGNTSLSSIDGKLTTTLNGLKVDGSAVTQPVSAASLPLPTGAATETTLSAINGKLGSLGQKVMTGSTPVVIASDQSAIPVTGSITATNSANGTPGSAIPSQATMIGGSDGTNLRSIKVNAAGEVATNVISSALPTGAATETTLSALNTKVPANLTVTSTRLLVDGSGVTQPVSAASLPLPTGAATETTLSALSGKLGSLGQKLMTGSAPVVIASDQSAIPASQSGTWNITNISGTVSLPTGAATSALQTTGNSSLSSIDGKLTTLNAKDFATQTTLAALLTELQLKADLTDTQPVSVASLPLPSGAATSADQTTANNSLSSIDGKLPALSGGRVPVDIGGSGSITITSGTITVANEVEISNDTGNPVPVSAASLPLPTGAATETTLSTLNGKVPSQGQAAMSASVPVVIASNQSSIPTTQAGKTAVGRARNNYATTNVTTGAYVQLVASLGATCNEIEIFDSSGQTLILATGGSGSEVDQIFVFPGGNGRVPLTIASGTRVSIKAVSATANDGEIAINFYS